MASNAGGWGGRQSEKAEGEGGALELNPKPPGVCLSGPSSPFSNARKTGFLYKNKHIAFPAHKNHDRLRKIDVFEEKHDENFVSGDCAGFPQAISSKNFISIF